MSFAFAPISAAPLSSLVFGVSEWAYGVEAVASVGSVTVKTDQHLTIAGMALTGAVGIVDFDADARVGATGVEGTLYVGDVHVTADQVVGITGLEGVLSLGTAEGFTGARVWPDGMPIYTAVGQVIARAESTQQAPSFVIQAELGTVQSVTTGNIFVTGVQGNLYVGDPHVMGHGFVNLTGVQGNLYVGDVRVWADINTGTGSDWHDVLQTGIILDSVYTFGGAPYSTPAIAGTITQTLDLDAETWVDVPTETTTDWESVVT